MKWKKAAFIVFLIFTASIFAVTSIISVVGDDSPSLDTVILGFDGGFVVPCDGDDVPGGPGWGG